MGAFVIVMEKERKKEVNGYGPYGRSNSLSIANNFPHMWNNEIDCLVNDLYMLQLTHTNTDSRDSDTWSSPLPNFM